MKMDYDLLRDILLRIENADEGAQTTERSFEDLCQNMSIVCGHLDLLVDAGYIETRVIKTTSSHYNQHIVGRITFQGHEYLNAVRDKKVWESTKKAIGEKTSSLSFDLIKSVATKVTLSYLGLG